MRVQLALMILNFVRNSRSVIRDPVRNPEPHAGFNEGLGPRTGSVFNGGSGTKHDFPNYVRDPMRDHGVQRGSQDIERDPDIRAGSNAGA